MTPAILVCLGLQALFTVAETALAHASRPTLRERAAEGDAGAEIAIRLLDDTSDRRMVTLVVGSNAALVAGVTFSGLALLGLGVPSAWWWAGAYLPAALLLGEALPRHLARPYADQVAIALAPLVQWLQLALAPLLLGMSLWTAVLRRLVPPETEPIRRQDIVQMLDDGQKHTIDPEERAFIRRLLALSETTAEEAMTPLVDVRAVGEDETVADAIRLVLDHGHSRLPVFRERVDNIVGRVELMDLLTAPDADLISKWVRPVPFVPDSKRADGLLREMRESRISFAAVVDEYGGSVGIVTMEDLLEQVVGDIDDERDVESPGIRKLADLEWRVPARTPIEDLEAAIGPTLLPPVPVTSTPDPRAPTFRSLLPPGDYETVAGLVLAATGRIPPSGAQVRVGRMTFVVEAASERAVQLVRVVISPEPG